MVEPKSRLQIFIRQKFARCLAKRFREKIDILFLNRQSRGHLVPAVLADLVRASGQSFDRIRSLNTASASLPPSFFVKPDYDCRSMILANNSRSDNAKHTRVPAARADNYGRVSR